jgi:uncharacterized membrane protein
MVAPNSSERMTTTDETTAASMPALSPGLDRAFRISLWLKAIDGVLEVIGGLLLFFVAPSTLDSVVRWAVAHDLTGSPHDWVAQHLLHSASTLSTSSTTFGAVYLLVHGGAKLVLVVLLLRRKLWAYPWMIGLLLLFVAYQMYRFAEQPGIGMILLSAFDLFVAWLTWREYRARTVSKGSP